MTILRIEPDLDNPCLHSSEVVFSQEFRSKDSDSVNQMVYEFGANSAEANGDEFDALLNTVNGMEEEFQKYQDEYLENLMMVKMKLKEMKRSHSGI